ncbi:hypothetical protein [Actinomadura verrucosospora]|uniref:hypothetical protein n=1 Tax=Actinomadura verrucosospora TaxID=46165 RepID=UPI0015631620|nr:hypothetical protein [Actinomadura verrucosospora]
MVAFDLAPRAGLQHGSAADTALDRNTLRALADEGNEQALDRLADLADARGDMEELNELLDEGSERAGRLLTRRAVAARAVLLRREQTREMQRALVGFVGNGVGPPDRGGLAALFGRFTGIRLC